MTHPIQYYSPWFRFIENEAPDLRLTVVYASEPTPEQQGVGFGASFEWDVPLRNGYRNEVLRPSRPGDDFGSDRFWGLDSPEIVGAIEASAPDAVLVSGWHSITQVRAILACRRRGIPLLYRGDTHLAHRELGATRLWRARTRWFLRRFDAYLSVGVRTHAYLRSFGVSEDTVFHSPHAVDNHFFAERAAPFQTARGRTQVRRELSLEGDTHAVLFVGKLTAHKRLEDLIRALARLRSPVVALVAGAGPQEEACRSLAAERGVAVRWLGFFNQSQLARIYAAADCLVLPSDWETWGLVVNEAMATGLPCIVSDRVGCAPDLVEPGRTGEIFPMGDVAELARGLERERERKRSGGFDADWCRRRASRYSFEAATKGLVEGCRFVVGKRSLRDPRGSGEIERLTT